MASIPKGFAVPFAISRVCPPLLCSKEILEDIWTVRKRRDLGSGVWGERNFTSHLSVLSIKMILKFRDGKSTNERKYEFKWLDCQFTAFWSQRCNIKIASASPSNRDRICSWIFFSPLSSSHTEYNHDISSYEREIAIPVLFESHPTMTQCGEHLLP